MDMVVMKCGKKDFGGIFPLSQIAPGKMISQIYLTAAKNGVPAQKIEVAIKSGNSISAPYMNGLQLCKLLGDA